MSATADQNTASLRLIFQHVKRTPDCSTARVACPSNLPRISADCMQKSVVIRMRMRVAQG